VIERSEHEDGVRPARGLLELAGVANRRAHARKPSGTVNVFGHKVDKVDFVSVTG
jgi:hypothetical protein